MRGFAVRGLPFANVRKSALRRITPSRTTTLQTYSPFTPFGSTAIIFSGTNLDSNSGEGDENETNITFDGCSRVVQRDSRNARQRVLYDYLSCVVERVEYHLYFKKRAT